MRQDQAAWLVVGLLSGAFVFNALADWYIKKFTDRLDAARKKKRAAKRSFT